MHNLSRAVQAAFDAADDIDALISIDYVVPGEVSAFDPVTEASVKADDVTTRIEQVVREFFTSEERRNRDIKAEDLKLTFQQKDLPTEVLTTDYILIGAVRYQIFSKSADPADLIWIVQARGAEPS